MANTYTNLLYHVVFGTKNRYRFITPAVEERLFPYLGGIVRQNRGKLLEINGTEDHVHLLIHLHPTIAVSDLLRIIKSESSRWLNESVLRYRKFGWQNGYGAFTVSHSASDSVRRYIQNQKQHHRGMGFGQEFERMLRKHGLENMTPRDDQPPTRNHGEA
jgi:REP element-mobilizing transposase RayT